MGSDQTAQTVSGMTHTSIQTDRMSSRTGQANAITEQTLCFVLVLLFPICYDRDNHINIVGCARAQLAFSRTSSRCVLDSAQSFCGCDLGQSGAG